MRSIVRLLLAALIAKASAADTAQFVAYYEGWGDYDCSDLMAVPDYIEVVIFAFAQPIAPNNITITSGRDPNKFAAAVQQLHGRGQKLTLSIGGASYSKDWAVITDYAAFAANVKAYVDAYGFDGVDIDYEVDGTRAQVPPMVEAFRQVMPASHYYLSYCGFSIGAYTVQDHPQWAGNPNLGVDIPVLTAVGSQIDLVNVMAYDAGPPPNYEPTDAVGYFSYYLGGKNASVALGVMIGKQWQNYQESPELMQQYSEFVCQHSYGGTMLWDISKDLDSHNPAPLTYSSAIEAGLTSCGGNKQRIHEPSRID